MFIMLRKTHEAEIAALAKEISALNDTIAAGNAEARKAGRQIAEKNAEIASLKAQIAMKHRPRDSKGHFLPVGATANGAQQ